MTKKEAKLKVEDVVTYGEGEAAKKAVIRKVNDDGTYDIELAEERTAEDQPIWYPNVSAEDLK